MNTKESKYQIAKQRVAALRGFYIHLGVFTLVNLLDGFCSLTLAGIPRDKSQGASPDGHDDPVMRDVPRAQC